MQIIDNKATFKMHKEFKQISIHLNLHNNKWIKRTIKIKLKINLEIKIYSLEVNMHKNKKY